HPNLVVGWTGNEYQARVVLMELRRLLLASGPKPDRETLRRVLTSIRVGQHLPVTLVGWIHDVDSGAFTWRSDWPDEVFYDSEYIVGSGARTYTNIAATRAASGSLKAVDLSLEHLGRLMADEAGQRRHQLAEKFGGGYEILT